MAHESESRPDQQQEGDDNTPATGMTRTTSSRSHFDRKIAWHSFSRLRSTRNQDAEPISPLAARLSQPSQASIRRMKETSRRAIGYVIGFLLTYTFPIILGTYMAAIRSSAPFAISFLSKVFFPLQGFVNLLVYTHPHVVSYRRNNSEHSWLCAFWEVVRSGGDSDTSQLSSERRRSLGRQRRALAIENSKKAGRRNSSNYESARGSLTPSPSALQLPTQQTEKRSSFSLPPIDLYSDYEEDRIREGTRDLEYCSNNDLFPIDLSTLMKSNLSDGMICSDNKDDDDDDDDTCDELFLKVSEMNDSDFLQTN